VKPVNRIGLDSSAVLAMILKEPGGKRLDDLLEQIESGGEIQVAISSVNWCEVLTKLHRDNDSMTGGELAALLAGVELVAFDLEGADLAAAFTRIDRSLSLGDRAYLALASIRKAKGWTTDKIWNRHKLPVDVELLR
jgi:PIN domain nuclease of toxin-antitoxin system